MLSLPKRDMGGRAGFTLLELVVAMVIMLGLAAVLVPQAVSRLGRGESTALMQNLETISTGVRMFRNDVGRYPDSIQHLVRLPAVPRDNCARLIPASSQANWAGPYLDRSVPAAGLPAGTSTIQLDIVRTPASVTPPGTLSVSVTSVDASVADALEAALDGNGDLTGGTVRWALVAGTGLGTLEYHIPIAGC